MNQASGRQAACATDTTGVPVCRESKDDLWRQWAHGARKRSVKSLLEDEDPDEERVQSVEQHMYLPAVATSTPQAEDDRDDFLPALLSFEAPFRAAPGAGAGSGGTPHGAAQEMQLSLASNFGNWPAMVATRDFTKGAKQRKNNGTAIELGHPPRCTKITVIHRS
ncbi:expressed unknown protein [Seminavis robusta]|uniref:Uncharacterized protein n=1 Tax=Seminavis robusta TaxID=568900 RepID=A0A9N8H2K0_9STRA|nr:expressed unknown protein [Seminavis robusta]|eukprot:Sro10_g008041.1  (165) ;mRNA; f:91642-92136